jgi:hypothetical protein
MKIHHLSRAIRRACIPLVLIFLATILILHLASLTHQLVNHSQPTPDKDSFNPTVLALDVSQPQPNIVELVKANISERINTAQFNSRTPAFYLNPLIDECQTTANEPLTLLALVIIAPELAQRRAVIRNTWANTNTQLIQSRFDLRVVFIVGLSDQQQLIEREFFLYNDIVMVDFLDSYYNLTKKVMTAFKWATEFCPNARHLLRINDDVIVNTRQLIRFFKNLPLSTTVNTIWGNWYDYQFPMRESNSKYFISHTDYGGEKYPAYMEGSAYVVTRELAVAIYNISLYVWWPPFSDWLEDIYVGMLCVYLDARSVNMAGFFSAQGQDDMNYEAVRKRDKSELFFVYLKSMPDFLTIWNLFIKSE